MSHDAHEWALLFWTHMARVDAGWRHSEFAGESSEHHLTIRVGHSGAGTVVIYHLWPHESTEIGRHAFTLAESPSTAAREVLQRIRECRLGAPLDLMHKDDFLRAVERAQAEADDALRLRDTLARWAERLLPHLERDPALTVGAALARFQHESAPAQGAIATDDGLSSPGTSSRLPSA